MLPDQALGGEGSGNCLPLTELHVQGGGQTGIQRLQQVPPQHAPPINVEIAFDDVTEDGSTSGARAGGFEHRFGYLSLPQRDKIF